jgi:hypothetical protein
MIALHPVIDAQQQVLWMRRVELYGFPEIGIPGFIAS